jgi:glycolate oxidase iron-sulfur subunit
MTQLLPHPRPEGETRQPPSDPLAGFPGLLECVHCGLCLQACPTYRVTGLESDSPRGRIALMRAQSEGRAAPADVARWVDRCVMCRACEPVCPSQVGYHELAERQRAGAARPRGLLARFTGSAAWQRAAGRLARFARRAGLLALLERAGPPRLRALARAVPRRPSAWRPPAGASFAARTPRRGSVALHLGCVSPEFFGAELRDCVAVLTHEGYDVAIPEQPPCCGALATHAGARAAGAARAAASIAALRGYDAVLIPAAGCAAHLCSADPRAGAQELLGFLARAGLRGPLRPVARRVAHAPPCHLSNVLRGAADVEALLDAIPGLERVALTEAALCCGAGGAAFLEQPALTSAIGARKAEHVRASGADCVVAGNPGCLLQIEAGLRALGEGTRVAHPISLLREALGATTLPARTVNPAARR